MRDCAGRWYFSSCQARPKASRFFVCSDCEKRLFPLNRARLSLSFVYPMQRGKRLVDAPKGLNIGFRAFSFVFKYFHLLVFQTEADARMATDLMGSLPKWFHLFEVSTIVPADVWCDGLPMKVDLNQRQFRPVPYSGPDCPIKGGGGNSTPRALTASASSRVASASAATPSADSANAPTADSAQRPASGSSASNDASDADSGDKQPPASGGGLGDNSSKPPALTRDPDDGNQVSGVSPISFKLERGCADDVSMYIASQKVSDAAAATAGDTPMASPSTPVGAAPVPASGTAAATVPTMVPIQHTEIFGTGNTFDGDMLIGLPPVPTSTKGVDLRQTRPRHASYSHSRGSTRSRSPARGRRATSPSCHSCSSSSTQRSHASSLVDADSTSRSRSPPAAAARQGSTAIANSASSLLSMRRTSGSSRYRSHRSRTSNHKRHHSHFTPHFDDAPIRTGTRHQNMSHLARPSSRSSSRRRALSPSSASSCGPCDHDKRRKVSTTSDVNASTGDRRRSMHSPSASPAPGSDGPPPLQPDSPAMTVFEDDGQSHYDVDMDGSWHSKRRRMNSTPLPRLDLGHSSPAAPLAPFNTGMLLSRPHSTPPLPAGARGSMFSFPTSVSHPQNLIYSTPVTPSTTGDLSLLYNGADMNDDGGSDPELQQRVAALMQEFRVPPPSVGRSASAMSMLTPLEPEPMYDARYLHRRRKSSRSVYARNSSSRYPTRSRSRRHKSMGGANAIFDDSKLHMDFITPMMSTRPRKSSSTPTDEGSDPALGADHRDVSGDSSSASVGGDESVITPLPASTMDYTGGSTGFNHLEPVGELDEMDKAMNGTTMRPLPSLMSPKSKLAPIPSGASASDGPASDMSLPPSFVVPSSRPAATLNTTLMSLSRPNTRRPSLGGLNKMPSLTTTADVVMENADIVQASTFDKSMSPVHATAAEIQATAANLGTDPLTSLAAASSSMLSSSSTASSSTSMDFSAGATASSTESPGASTDGDSEMSASADALASSAASCVDSSLPAPLQLSK